MSDKKKRSLRFTKACAAGNDFILIDTWKGPNKITSSLRKELAKNLCRRHFSIGADGVVFFDPPQGAVDFSWDFYNADGSSAEMCGNAARAVAFYAFRLGWSKGQARFLTAAGIVEATSREHRIAVSLPGVQWEIEEVALPSKEKGYLVDSGVPHIVIWTDSVRKQSDLRAMAKELRNLKIPGPRGSNITFLQQKSQNQVSAGTFERGVEDFTLACGTGAVAAALAHTHAQSGTVEVDMPGGHLTVELDLDRRKAVLIGPAEIVFEGQVEY